MCVYIYIYIYIKYTIFQKQPLFKKNKKTTLTISLIYTSMAISYSNLPSLTFPSPITKNQFPFPIKSLSTKPPKRCRFEIRFSTSKNNEFRVREVVETRVGLVLPGGSWWSLGEDDDDDGNVESRTKSAPAKPITAVFALRRMWELISGDGRWAIFVGFGALVIAAVRFVNLLLFLFFLFCMNALAWVPYKACLGWGKKNYWLNYCFGPPTKG